ncbi:MAG: hypothetical protein K0V04_04115 [Deltaproteobacteria bacterium]|nr:hypothetical protein [Deltaproteobacteria bacterium]
MTRAAITTVGLTITLAAGCSAGHDDERFLFGLQEDEIREAVAHYTPDADVDVALEQMRAPFDCARYGAACDQLGAEGAQLALHDVWMGALDRAEPAELVATLDEAWKSPRSLAATELVAPSDAAAAPASPSPVPGPGVGLPGPFPHKASASDIDICLVSPLILDTLDLDVTVSHFAILATGTAEFEANRTVSDLFTLTTPRVDDYTLRGSLTTGSGITLGSKIKLVNSDSTDSLSISGLTAEWNLDMWSLVTEDGGGSCGGLRGEATASL